MSTVLADHLHHAYMEVFPAPSIEERLEVLPKGSYVAVTCSPTRGVDHTLDMSAHLVERGFRVITHVAARTVRDRGHLQQILRRLDALAIDSVFVPGGDADTPVGDYSSSFELLRDIADIGHRFEHLGVAAYPEGHPAIERQTLWRELERKQGLATYLVTQMCFDAKVLASWLRELRQRGVGLPAWLGIPGSVERGALLRTSMRIGVGDSLRFLKKNKRVAAQILASSVYTPDDLLARLGPVFADRSLLVAGLHIYCFNQVEQSESWRLQALRALDQDPGAREK